MGVNLSTLEPLENLDTDILNEIFKPYASKNDGWMTAASLREKLSKKGVNFKDFGCSKFSDFIKKFDNIFESKKGDDKTTILVKLKS